MHHVESHPERSWWRVLALAVCWQAIPATVLLVRSWSDADLAIWVLVGLVVAVVPLVAARVHRSWAVGLAALSLPALAFAVMYGIFALIMSSAGGI